jgi:hypothetical protein
MTKKGQRRIWPIGILLLVGALVTPAMLPAETAEMDPGWRIRFYAASIDFDNSNGYGHGSRPGYDIDVGFGLGFNAEYRISPRLGLDLGILGGAAVDVAWNSYEANDWVWAAYDTLSFTPLSVGLDVHLTPRKNVDLYVCPMLAWVHYGGLVVHSGRDWTATTIDFDQDLGVGLGLGLGVPFSERERWFFNANLTYFESSLESDSVIGSRMAGDHDATILGLGLGYRFKGRQRVAAQGRQGSAISP